MAAPSRGFTSPSQERESRMNEALNMCPVGLYCYIWEDMPLSVDVLGSSARTPPPGHPSTKEGQSYIFEVGTLLPRTNWGEGWDGCQFCR